MKLNLKNVSIGTWTRILTLFLALINQVAVSLFDFQLLPFSDEQLNEAVSMALTIVASLVAGWKNNSLTEAAQTADEVLEEMKGGK